MVCRFLGHNSCIDVVKNSGDFMDISLPSNIENILKNKVSDGLFVSMDEAAVFAIKFAFIDNNFLHEQINALNV